jgi:disulfide bond formation protein DsbB
MPDEIKKKEKNKMSFFDYFTEVVGWLQIVASPLLAGLLIAAYIYFSNPTDLRLFIAISVALLGLILGIVLATRIWKKQGTMNFVSRISATPELDNVDEEKKQ